MIGTLIVFASVASVLIIYALALWFGVDRTTRDEAETKLVEQQIKTELIRAGRE